MNDFQSQSQVAALEQKLANALHEITVLKAHLAMFTRRLADPEHEKRSVDRRKQAYNVIQERRNGFDRRQMMSGLKWQETVQHHPV